MSGLPGEPPVGILYPGDLGSHLGKLLREQGHRIVTTLAGRSPQTAQRAREAGFEIRGSLPDVLAAAGVVLSVVPPAAAVALAREVGALPAPARPSVYVDLNAISPETVRAVATAVAPSGMSFVDGAIHGMASQLRARGTLYLSGPEAAAVARLFEGALRVLGDQPGQASAFKMLISGMAKGVVALFVEMAVAARQAGLLDDLLSCYREAYPSVMALVDRLLPTYPRHAARRGDELAEVEQMLRSLGLRPRVVEGARQLTADVGRLALEGHRDRPEGAEWSVLEVLEAMFARLRGGG
jgi:3-hydroxyisobutyrate dehydrogenase-like beta-hydroxyacid dehydrogenase